MKTLGNLPNGVLNHILSMLPVSNRRRAAVVSKNFRERVNNLNLRNHAKLLYKKKLTPGLWSKYNVPRKKVFLTKFHLEPKVMNRYIAILNKMNRNNYAQIYEKLTPNERTSWKAYLNRMSK